MIDEKVTFEKYGYTSDFLSKGSQKLIVRICDKCGKIDEIIFRGYKKAKYSNLCKKCVLNQPEIRKANSKRVKQYNIDHPEFGKAHSEWLIQWHKNHPEIRKTHSEWMIKYINKTPIT